MYFDSDKHSFGIFTQTRPTAAIRGTALERLVYAAQETFLGTWGCAPSVNCFTRAQG